MQLTKKYIAIIVAAVVAACLVIAGIVVTIVLVTKKSSKDSSEETTTVSFATTTPTTTTTVPPILYYNETLIIAFNIGYQNNDSSFENLQNSLNNLINHLYFNGSLKIRLVPYSDTIISINETFDNPQNTIVKINEILSEPVIITSKNPSQTNALSFIKTNTVLRYANFDAETVETKYCFFSPSKDAYANENAIVQDSKEAGILITNITTTSNFALILMPNMSIDDYNIKPNNNFIDTTYDNVTVAVDFLDPDEIPPPTTTPTITTTVPPITYYNETLIIAFNIGYQNNNSSFTDLQNSLNALIDHLYFNGSLIIRLVPYTDKIINVTETFDNPQNTIAKINEILLKPENITSKNPSQTTALTTIITNPQSTIFDAETIERKYCFFSPSKEAYADKNAIATDSKQAGIIISNITVTSNFALILMPNISIADYNIKPNNNFIDTTYDNVTVAVEFLDPDQIPPPTTTTTTTTATTTVPPILYKNETLIIAFNIGYQNNDSSFEDLKNSLSELINHLYFNGSLIIRLVPYSDTINNTNEIVDNREKAIAKITEILSNPEKLTGKNPSQTNALTTIKTNSQYQSANFDAETVETKYCFFSPSKEAYANESVIVEDSKQTGILITNITEASKFALILMPNMYIVDYNITFNHNFIDTTFDNATAAVEFLDSDQLSPRTTPATTPKLNETISTAIIQKQQVQLQKLLKSLLLP